MGTRRWNVRWNLMLIGALGALLVAGPITGCGGDESEGDQPSNLEQQKGLAFYDWTANLVGKAQPSREDAIDLAATVPEPTVVISGGRGEKQSLDYYVLRNRPSLTIDDIVDPGIGTNASTGKPSVTFAFTAKGEKEFLAMTSTIAADGLARATGSLEPEEAEDISGSFVVALDGKVISRDIVNFTEYPDGIDARTGFATNIDLTLAEARQIVKMLRSAQAG